MLVIFYLLISLLVLLLIFRQFQKHFKSWLLSILHMAVDHVVTFPKFFSEPSLFNSFLSLFALRTQQNSGYYTSFFFSSVCISFIRFCNSVSRVMSSSKFNGCP